MNITETYMPTECQCDNLWTPIVTPIVIIVLQALGLGRSYLKYYLGNRKQTGLLDSIKKLFLQKEITYKVSNYN